MRRKIEYWLDAAGWILEHRYRGAARRMAAIRFVSTWAWRLLNPLARWKP